MLPAGASPPWATPGLRRIATTAALTVIAVAVIGVAASLPGKSPGVIAGSLVALAVAVCGTAFVVFRGATEAVVPDLAVMVGVGLAGLAIAALLPASPGSVVIYLALVAIGMRAPLAQAIVPALIVFAALNFAYLLLSKAPITDMVSQDIGVAWVFTVAAFTRSARISQERARAAQARAEDLLVQLQASQAAQAQAAALTERARLAREIHDILAHALSGLILALDTMELLGRQAASDPDSMDRMMQQVSRAQRIARDGLADTRRAISALRGDELPGPALLDRLVRDTAAATGLRADLGVAGQPRPLSPEVGLALYRTAQEALTNAAKYAGPGARVELRLRYENDAVELVIEDFKPDEPAETGAGLTFGGYGLTGMRERAELQGGSLTAGPTGTGFCVRVRLLAAPAEADPVAATPVAVGRLGA
jgi:signal transduction histidine kinase